MPNYCEPQHLNAYGYVRGSVPNPARLVHSVSTSANTLTLDEHGFYDGDALLFRADSVDGALPDPLVEGTTYYAIRVTPSTFSVASSAGGNAIDLTTAGLRTLVIGEVSPTDAIVWASAMIEDSLVGNILPLPEPYPEIVRTTCAELAAAKLLSMAGAPPKALTDLTEAAIARMRAWSKGVPVRASASTTRAGLARAASSPYSDARGWRSDAI